MNSYPFDRLVSGAGDIKLTKDGNVLLHEMVRVAVLGKKKILTSYSILGG